MPRLKYVHRRRLKRLLYGCCACLLMCICMLFFHFRTNVPVRVENKLYVYWMSSDEELEPDMDLNFDDVPNIVPVRVRAIKHETVVQRAYNDGHSVVLVLTDETQVSPLLFSSWEQLLVAAPSDWTMLQMWTSNPIIQRHCETLNDPWITWFPEHTGNSAYFINRKGMKQLLDSNAPLFARGQSYTVTRFFVKTMQLFELAKSVPRWSFTNTSTLVITTTVVETKAGALSELARWQADYYAVSATWHLTIVVRTRNMERYVIKHWPRWPSVLLRVEVLQGQYNKFMFVRRSVTHMSRYKHVLIKDSDIALTGFPWRTFLDASRGAVISGALRQLKRGVDKRQWFHFQDGDTWKRKYAQSYKYIQSRAVPFLEQFFVLLDGKFANWFFHRALTDTFILDGNNIPVQSNWGPDTVWCGAAAQWEPERTACLLVPLVAKHSDTRQVTFWNSSARRKYENQVQANKCPAKAAHGRSVGPW